MAKKSVRAMRLALNRALKFINAYPHATNAEVMEGANVSQATASRARSWLRENTNDPRFLRAAGRPATKRPKPPSTDAPLPSAEVLATSDIIGIGGEAIDKATQKLISYAEAETQKNLSEISPQEMERILTAFIRDLNQSPAVRMSAMQMLTKIRADLLGRDSIGPGKPLTAEDQIVRLSLLHKAVGPRIALEAYRRAFELKDDPTNGETVNDTTSIPVTEPPIEAGHDHPDQTPEVVRTIDMGP